MLYQLVDVSLSTRTAVHEDVRVVDLSKQLRTTLNDEERFAQKYLVSSDTTYLSLFREQRAIAESLLDTLSGFRRDTAVYRFAVQTKSRHQWMAALVCRAVRDTIGTETTSARVEMMMDSLDHVFRNVELVVRQKQEILTQVVRTSDFSVQRSGEVALILTVGGIIVAVIVALALTRSITLPLRALVRATDEVARGTFTRVAIAPRGEMGRLATAFNDMGERLRSANAARAEMMQHISHEIRMPLQTMHSAYYLLTEQLAGPVSDRQRKLLDTIMDNVDKIARFSNQFLDLARIEAGMMEYELGPTDIASVISPLVDETRLNADRKKVAVELISASIPLARANAERCVQVFTNLLSNAVKYTNEGGSITVALAPSRFGVRVTITDTGVGISPQELPLLFTKFYRAKSAGRKSGTGIGLALVKALVTGMGGQVYAQSSPGHGSTFVVEFQAAV